MTGSMSTPESTTWGTVCVCSGIFREINLFGFADLTIFCTESFSSETNATNWQWSILHCWIVKLNIAFKKGYFFAHYGRLLICRIKVIPPPPLHSPLDTCCTFLIFGPPLSVKVQNTAVGIVLRHSEICTGTCVHYRYLIFGCAARQAFNFGFKLDKHVSYGGDPGVKVFVFIVFGAEILLVPLTLLQSNDRTVCPTWKHGCKWWMTLKNRQ